MRMVPAVLAAVLINAAPLSAAPLYTLTKTVPLGTPDKWDYLAFDPAHNRVLVAHGTETTIVDAASLAIIGHLKPLDGAHGQAVTAAGKIFADSGKSGTVTMFDGASFRAEKTVPAGQDADGVIYEPMSNRIVVVDGDPGTATIIDASTGSAVATVALGGSPESVVADGKGAAFIDIADKNQLVRLRGTQVEARWDLVGCEEPTGLAIDSEQERLFVSCRNGKMLAVNGQSGKVEGSFPIGLGTDSAAFEPARKRAFSSNNQGTVSIFEEQRGAVMKLAEMPTAPGARTMTVDPRTGRLFFVTAEVTGTEPPKHPGGGPRFVYKPGTVKLLVFDPAS